MSRDPFIDLADEALAAATLLDRISEVLIRNYWPQREDFGGTGRAEAAYDARASAQRLRNLAADVRTIRYAERSGG